MKIIKEGDLYNEKVKLLRFECTDCGCIYETTQNSDDYRYDITGKLIAYFASCPTCNRENALFYNRYENKQISAEEYSNTVKSEFDRVNRIDVIMSPPILVKESKCDDVTESFSNCEDDKKNKETILTKIKRWFRK